MGIFNIKKDINQLKRTREEIKRAGKKIEEKSPLFGSIMKSIFVIIKWLLIIGIIVGIILTIVAIVHHYAVELPYEAYQKEEARKEEARKEKYQDCLDECDIKHPYIGLILPDDPNPELLLEKRALRNNCLSNCEEKYAE